MVHLFAFLRAINVGGHTVKMDRLRQIFVSMGFSGVETVIASGNVVFDAPAEDIAALERQIAAGLRAALGYDVATFIRTSPELAAVIANQPFPPTALDAAVSVNIAFLHGGLDDETESKLMALRTDIDDFAVHDREIYWLCRQRQSESTFSNAVLEKTTGQPSTLRGVKTLKQMIAKGGPAKA